MFMYGRINVHGVDHCNIKKKKKEFVSLIQRWSFVAMSDGSIDQPDIAGHLGHYNTTSTSAPPRNRTQKSHKKKKRPEEEGGNSNDPA